jgi:hypothetical protein
MDLSIFQSGSNHSQFLGKISKHVLTRLTKFSQQVQTDLGLHWLHDKNLLLPAVKLFESIFSYLTDNNTGFSITYC